MKLKDTEALGSLLIATIGGIMMGLSSMILFLNGEYVFSFLIGVAVILPLALLHETLQQVKDETRS